MVEEKVAGVFPVEKLIDYEYKDGVVYLKSSIPCEAIIEFLDDTEALYDYPVSFPSTIRHNYINEKTETPVLCSGPTKSHADKNNLILIVESKNPEEIDEVIGELKDVIKMYVKECKRISDNDFEEDNFGSECQTYLCWSRCKNRNKENCPDGCMYLIDSID